MAGSAVVRVAVLTLVAFTSALLAQNPVGTRPVRGTISVSQLRVPDKARTRLVKAISAHSHKNELEARKQVDSALSMASDYPDALTFRGYLELDSRQFDAALVDLQHSLRVDPNYGLTYLHLGSVLVQLGRFDEAIQNLQRFSEFEPQAWESPYVMSKAWIGKQDYARALESIDQASALGADDAMTAPIHLLRGDALAGLRRYDEAATEMNVYLKREPTGQLADMVRAMLVKLRTASAMAHK
jgi:tetratricopeptide (TPR) repeat protein